VQASAPVGDASRAVDALVTWPSGRLAVEVDGPTHFIPSPDGVGTVRSTATRLRDHQLAAWGLPMLSIEVAGKPPRHFSSAAFRAELAARLRAAGVPVAVDKTCSSGSCNMPAKVGLATGRGRPF
jgi:hypothetical protein